MQINRLKYCQYLLSSQINYTITNFSEHTENVSHDRIRRYLKNDKVTPRVIWEHNKAEVVQSNNGYILFDDTVLDKRHSNAIEEVRMQYSGNAGRVIKGIGVVTCVYVNPEINKFWIIDYRIFSPGKDGYSKLQHVSEMLRNAYHSKKLKFRYVLMDTWYATKNLMVQIDEIGKIFYCPLKKNRFIANSGESEFYKVSEKKYESDELQKGKLIAINKFPDKLEVKLFSVAVSTNRTDYVVTNDLTQNSIDDVQNVYVVRWKIEEFHRELKQLTGVEKCQCRIARMQRNHIACAIMVWTCLKRVANTLGKTIYSVKKGLLRSYLVNELESPAVVFA